MTARKLSPIPASIPRDLILPLIAKHAPDLYASMKHADARYVARRDVVEAVFTFDPHEYLRVTSEPKLKRKWRGARPQKQPHPS